MAEKPEPAVDIYRDTPVRLLGYANEVGEAFRALTPVWVVRASYGVSTAYVLADTADKTMKESKVPGSTARSVSHAALDTLVWQALASVMVPGLTINRLCALSLFTLARAAPFMALSARRWTTTGLGLAAIPFIVKPIDELVHWTMDKTVRPYLDLKQGQD